MAVTITLVRAGTRDLPLGTAQTDGQGHLEARATSGPPRRFVSDRRHECRRGEGSRPSSSCRRLTSPFPIAAVFALLIAGVFGRRCLASTPARGRDAARGLAIAEGHCRQGLTQAAVSRVIHSHRGPARKFTCGCRFAGGSREYARGRELHATLWRRCPGRRRPATADDLVERSGGNRRHAGRVERSTGDHSRRWRGSAVPRSTPVRFSLLLMIAALLAVSVGAPAAAAPPGKGGNTAGKAVFFAADGMRQDIVEKYAAAGVMPTMKRVPEGRHEGVRQRPADPGAAEHGRRLVHASRPARGRASTDRPTTRSTRTGTRSATARTAAFDPGVLQAESIAQSAERGGLKVAQVEWAGGRNASIQGPTIDFQGFFSGRGVATNFIGEAGDAAVRRRAVHQRLRPAVRSSRRVRRPQAAVPRRRGRRRRDRLDGRADVGDRQPREGDAAPGARRSRHRTSTASTRTSSTAPTTARSTTTRSCSRGRRAARHRRRRHAAPRASGPTSRSRSTAARSTARPPACSSRSRSSARISPRPPVPHVASPARSRRGRRGRASRVHGDFDEYVARKFPTSTAADFAILEAGVDERGDVRRAGPVLGDRPRADARVRGDQVPAGPRCSSACRRRTSSSTSSSASSARRCPIGAANPAYDDVFLDGDEGRPRRGSARGSSAPPTEEADEVLTLARALVGKNPTTFVSSDHGFAPQFLAIDASKPLSTSACSSRRRPRTAARRPARRSARRRPAGPVARCRST